MNLTESQKAKVEDILNQMTLEEKIGQMNLESPSIVGGFEVPFDDDRWTYLTGGVSENYGNIGAGFP